MMIMKAIKIELLKLKRAPITWVLALVYCIAPLMMGLMMVVLKNPELGRQMGLVTTKAQLMVGKVDWATYLNLTGFIFVGGIMVLAIVNAYLFGREYVEGTAKILLTLPIRREEIVLAKLVVSALWYLSTAILVYAEALLVGTAIGLPGFSRDLLLSNVAVVAQTALMVFLASSVNAWITVATRGYLAPVGIAVLLLLIGDLFAHTGWAPWVPWSIILLSAQGAQGGSPAVGAPSFVIMGAMFLAGSYATYLTIERADNTQ